MWLDRKPYYVGMATCSSVVLDAGIGSFYGLAPWFEVFLQAKEISDRRIGYRTNFFFFFSMVILMEGRRRISVGEESNNKQTEKGPAKRELRTFKV